MKSPFRSALLVIAASLAVTACGDGDKASQAVSEGQTAAVEREIQIDQSIMGDAGRWTTPDGSISGDSQLTIDIASNGNFTIDVRQTGADGKKAIIESSTGTVSKQGNAISGTTKQGDGVHSVLKRYASWTITAEDGAGSISTGEGSPVTIKREIF